MLVVSETREFQEPEESDWLESMASIRTSYCEMICTPNATSNEREAFADYVNEPIRVLTKVNNDEMGILVSSDEDDADLYREIFADQA